MMSVVPDDDQITEESIESEVVSSVEDALNLLSTQRQIHLDLMEQGPGSDAEQRLLACIEQRERLERTLGRAMMRWLIIGGGFELTLEESEGVLSIEPTFEPEPEPEPEEPVPESEPEDPEEEPPAVVPEPQPEPEDPEPEPQPSAPVASMDQLQQLVSNGLTPNWKDDRKAKVKLLRRLFRTVPKPAKLRTKGAVVRTIQALCVAGGRADDWLEFPRPVQRQIIGLIISTARYIQDECKQDIEPQAHADMRSLFSSMTRWSGEHRPGFVPGLSRHNSPDHGSWLADAKFWWKELREELHGPGEDEGPTEGEALSELEDDLQRTGLNKDMVARSIQAVLDAGVSQSDHRLVSLLIPHYDLLKGSRKMKTLKNAVREAIKSDDETSSGSGEVLDVSPGVLKVTEGKVAAIAGGEPRPHAVRRIKETFRFENVVWDPAEKRRIQSLEHSIAQGSFDVLFVLRRFISHGSFADLVTAGNDAGIVVCMIDHGYGVTQLNRALEHTLGLKN